MRTQPTFVRHSVNIFLRIIFYRVQRVATLFLKRPDVVKLRRDFCDKARGFLNNCLSVVISNHQRVCDVKLLGGAREGYVPEAALFLFAFCVAQATWAWELAVRSPDDEDRAPF